MADLPDFLGYYSSLPSMSLFNTAPHFKLEQVFTYIHIRVRVPDSQRTTRTPDVGLCLPPSQVPEHNALHHAPGKWFRELNSRICQSSPE